MSTTVGTVTITETGKKKENIRKVGDFREVDPPRWASIAIFAIIVLSYSVAIYVTPVYFTSEVCDNGQGSRNCTGESVSSTHGGLEGAIEVVKVSGSPNYILACIPFFLAMILAEMVISVAAGLECVGGRYDFSDTWSSLTAGITQQMSSALVKAPLKLGLLPYSYIYYRYSVPSGLAQMFPVDQPWVWLFCFVFTDLCYYWFHRLAHQVQILWAGHSVHHSSEYYNLSTALRQSWFATLVGSVFYLPMALFFHPALYSGLDQANVAYQFWVHTCLIRRLGVLEWIFMTPSHHRVHHDRRVHKNFGGFLIIWDRLFGTFLDETEGLRHLDSSPAAKSLPQEEVMLFGTSAKVRSWTDVVLQLQFWQPIFDSLRRFRGLSCLLRSALVGPGYSTVTAHRALLPPSSAAQRIRKHSDLPAPGKAYVLVHFLMAVVAGFVVLLFSSTPYSLRLLLGLCVLFSLYCQGLLLDAEGSKGVRAEAVKCFLLLLFSAAFLYSPEEANPYAELRTPLVVSMLKAGAGAQIGSLVFLVSNYGDLMPVSLR